MNVKNNKRRRDTVRKIETVFMDFFRTQEISQIKVTAICQKAGINRGTFYANFVDVYDLADKLHKRLRDEVNSMFESNVKTQFTNADFLNAFQHIFEHIKENQELYYFYFKLGHDDYEDLKLLDIYEFKHIFPQQHLDYHISFFKGGFNNIIKKWLDNGCKETPIEMQNILLFEYHDRFLQQ